MHGVIGVHMHALEIVLDMSQHLETCTDHLVYKWEMFIATVIAIYVLPVIAEVLWHCTCMHA